MNEAVRILMAENVVASTTVKTAVFALMSNARVKNRRIKRIFDERS